MCRGVLGHTDRNLCFRGASGVHTVGETVWSAVVSEDLYPLDEVNQQTGDVEILLNAFYSLCSCLHCPLLSSGTCKTENLLFWSAFRKSSYEQFITAH